MGALTRTESAKVQPGSLQTSKMESLGTIVKDTEPSIIAAKLSILDVCGGSGYISS